MIDIDRLHNLFGGDDGLIRKFLTQISTELPKNINQLQDCISESDFATASRTAHDIKNHLRYLGAESAADLAEEIEKRLDNPHEFSERNYVLETLKFKIDQILKDLERVSSSK